MDSVNENVIEWLRGDTVAAITAPGHSKLKGMVLRAAEKSPDEVKIIARNKDGSVFAHVPVSYVSVRRPRQQTLTEEQKEEFAKRMQLNRVRTSDTAETN